MTYRITFIDSAWSVESPLSILADNPGKRPHNSKSEDRKSCLEYVEAKDELPLIFKCLKCNKSHKKYFSKGLVKRFGNTYEFCDGDIDKFCLMLLKGVYPKKVYYSNLTIKNITDENYKQENSMRKL